MNWLHRLLVWLTPSQETQNAWIAASMKMEGYTNLEIELFLRSKR